MNIWNASYILKKLTFFEKGAELLRKFQSDLTAICADLRSVQISSGHKVVRLAPIKPEPTKASRRRLKPRG